jgi:hypothetical protein
MNRSRLSQIFVGLASKKLTVHQIKQSSHGHEFQGSRSLVTLLGKKELRNNPCVYFWLPRNEEDELIRLESVISWYDARKNYATRSPEWRLYYPVAADEIVRGKTEVGDLAVVCLGCDGTIYVILAAAGSSWERKLKTLLNLPTEGDDFFKVAGVDKTTEVGLAEEMFLGALGFEVPMPVDSRAEAEVERLYERFAGKFPATGVFSKLARQSFVGTDIVENPDATLAGWMEWETRLFTLFESKILTRAIPDQVMPKGKPDVPAFLKLARSVGNTRFSRAGRAFEHHVGAMLTAHGVVFDFQAFTENGNTPDFLFPSVKCYFDPTFDLSHLKMLAVKTSCKERWKQILAEADRIERKHLLTLECPLSSDQTDDMVSRKVALVVPADNHRHFTPKQRKNILSVRGFLDEVLGVQQELIAKGFAFEKKEPKKKTPRKTKK